MSKKKASIELYAALAGVAGILAGGVYLYQKNAVSVPSMPLPDPTTTTPAASTPAVTVGGTKGNTYSNPIFGVDLSRYYGINFSALPTFSTQPVTQPQGIAAGEPAPTYDFGINVGRYL